MSRDVTTVSGDRPCIDPTSSVWCGGCSREGERTVRMLDHQAVPHEGGHHRRRPLRVVGPPRARSELGRLEPVALAERVDQPTPTLTVGPLEARLPPTRARRTARGVRYRAALAVPRARARHRA